MNKLVNAANQLKHRALEALPEFVHKTFSRGLHPWLPWSNGRYRVVVRRIGVYPKEQLGVEGTGST